MDNDKSEWFARILKSIGDAVIVTDTMGCAVFMNPAAESLLDCPLEGIRGKPFEEVFCDIDEEADYPPIEGLDIDPPDHVGYVTGNGRQIILERSISSIENDDGFEGQVILLHDISERKHAEDALRDWAERAVKRSEAKYRTLLEQIPAIAYIAPLDNLDSALYVSPQFEKYLGYSQAECASDPHIWRKTLHPDDCGHVLAEVARCHTTQEPFLCEYRSLARDGEVKWFHDEAVIVRDDDGHPLYYQGVMFDITDQKRAESSLRQSEALYRSLVEKTTDGYFISEFPSGCIIFFNERLCELSGYTHREAMHLEVWDLIALDEHRRVHEQVWSKAGHEGHICRESIFTAVRKDGSTFLAEVTVSSVPFQGRQAVQGIIRDVSERERLWRQLQYVDKMQGLGVLAAEIAHEVLNPLAICSSAVQFLMEEGNSPEFQKECVQKIHSGIGRVSGIIRSLLGFARSYPPATEMARLDLLSIVEETTALISFKAKSQRVKIQSRSCRSPVFVGGIESFLQQVFMNLLLNALNAMPDGGILSLLIEKTNREVLVHVTHNGSGISETEVGNIFDPFRIGLLPGDRASTALPLCYSIVKQHSGTIECKSTEGEGTTFTVRLPIAPGEE